MISSPGDCSLAAAALGISDVFPTLALLVMMVYHVVRKHAILVNRLLLTQGVLIFLNAIVENATTLPSPYGYARCTAYMGVRDSSEMT